MATSTLRTPYSSAYALLPTAAVPSYVNDYDKQRLGAYAVYEDMYDNLPTTYQLAIRGSEDDPLYVPSAKIIVEACNRFLGVGFDYAVIPLNNNSPEDVAGVRMQFDRLFRREDFYRKYSTNKRYGLIRGDAIWHIVGDLDKPEGRRISMYEVDPSSYFPIYDDDELDKLVGCHLIDQVSDPKEPSKVYIRRLTYRKDPENGTITSEIIWFETGGWDDRPETGQVLKQVRVEQPLTVLPPAITSLPVYHIANTPRRPVDPFGRSELSGLERLAGGLTQSLSDEDLTLALESLGLYVTNGAPPQNADGSTGGWILGPGRVVEMRGPKTGEGSSYFERIQGVTDVTPMQDHMKAIWGWMKQATAMSDIAIGNVDVQIAQSGIALALQMGPILAHNSEKENEMLGTYDHMLYDLAHGWFAAYEGYQLPEGIDLLPKMGDPMPVDRALVIEEARAMLDMQVWTVEQAQAFLNKKIGMDFDLSKPDAILNQARLSSIANDPFGQRLNAELNVDGDEDTSGAA